jgi:hypothetical protein
MIKVNEKATNAMLSGLGNNVQVKNLNLYFNSELLGVEIHVGGIIPLVGIPKELFGNKNDEFYKQHILAGSFCVFPEEFVKQRRRLEQLGRSTLRKWAIVDGKHMSVQDYKEGFKKEIESIKQEYMELPNIIRANYSQWVDLFKAGLHDYIAPLPCYSPEMEKALFPRIPSVEKVARSYYMSVEPSAFPVLENVSILDPTVADDVRDSAANQAINLVYEVMGTILNEVNSSMSEKITQHINGKGFDGHTIRSLTDLINKVKKNNVLKHPIVDEIVKDLNKIVSKIEVRKETLNISIQQSLDADIVEMMEQVMIYIFGFANEVGVEIEEAEAMPHATAELCTTTA